MARGPGKARDFFRVSASLAVLIWLLATISPWVAQRLFWYAHRAPPWQPKHAAKHAPDLGLSSVRRIPSNPYITDRRLNLLDANFSHQLGDVWVITYPKAGATWVQYVVSLLQKHPSVASILDLHDACPWPEVDLGLLSTPMHVFQQSARSLKGPRCFKSHWPRHDYLMRLPTSSRVIYVLRDAESLAVSNWNHIFRLFGYYLLRPGEMSWDDYFEKWFSGDVEMGGYFEHVASWWEIRNRPNVLIVRYEDLRSDPAGTIRRIAAHIGVGGLDVSAERIAEILEATSNENMPSLREGFADRMLVRLGIIRAENVSEDSEGKRVGFNATQRARVVKRYESLLKPMGMPRQYMIAPGSDSDSKGARPRKGDARKAADKDRKADGASKGSRGSEDEAPEFEPASVVFPSEQ